MKKIASKIGGALLLAASVFFSQVADAQTIQVSGKVLLKGLIIQLQV